MISKHIAYLLWKIQIILSSHKFQFMAQPKDSRFLEKVVVSTNPIALIVLYNFYRVLNDLGSLNT